MIGIVEFDQVSFSCPGTDRPSVHNVWLRAESGQLLISLLPC